MWGAFCCLPSFLFFSVFLNLFWGIWAGFVVRTHSCSEILPLEWQKQTLWQVLLCCCVKWVACSTNTFFSPVEKRQVQRLNKLCHFISIATTFDGQPQHLTVSHNIWRSAKQVQLSQVRWTCNQAIVFFFLLDEGVFSPPDPWKNP